MRIISAPLVMPVSAPPIRDGAILVEGDAIGDVGSLKEVLSRHPKAPVERIEGAALLPAFVNAHTHLELTSLARPQKGLSFAQWIREVIAIKRSASAEDFGHSMADGLSACANFGQGTVADVLSRFELARLYRDADAEVLCQPEVIAASPQVVGPALERVRSLEYAINAVFAHAPYTLCAQGYEEAFALAGELGAGFFTHLAESPAEVEFCLDGTGDVLGVIYDGLPVSPPQNFGAHPLHWLSSRGLLGPRTTLVHGVHLSDRHIEEVASAKASVVLCPRSNKNLGVGLPKAGQMLKAGVNLGLGTDSVLSAGSLDLREDMRLLVDECGVSPADALWMATLGGARALGVAKGALTKGASADIIAVSLENINDAPEGIIFSGKILKMISRGRLVRAGEICQAR